MYLCKSFEIHILPLTKVHHNLLSTYLSIRVLKHSSLRTEWDKAQERSILVKM